MSEAILEQGHPDPKWIPQKPTGDLDFEPKRKGTTISKILLILQVWAQKVESKFSSFFTILLAQASVFNVVIKQQSNRWMSMLSIHGRPMQFTKDYKCFSVQPVSQSCKFVILTNHISHVISGTYEEDTHWRKRKILPQPEPFQAFMPRTRKAAFKYSEDLSICLSEILCLH